MTPRNPTSGNLLCRLKRGTLLTAVGRFAGMGAVFILHVFLARNLLTTDYATFVLTWSWTTLFSLIGSFGLSTLACRYLAESYAKQDARRARKTAQLVTLMGAGTIVAAAVLGMALMAAASTTRLPFPTWPWTTLVAISLWIVLLATSQIQSEMFRGIHHLFAASLFGGMSGGLLSNLTLLVTLIGWSCFAPLNVTVVIWSISLALGLQCFVALVLFRIVWPVEDSSAPVVENDLTPLSVRNLVSEATPIMTTQVTSFGVAQFDIWVVGVLGGAESLAIYAVARRLALLVAIPVNQMGLIISAFIAQLYVQQRRQALVSLIKGASTLGAICTLPLVAILVLAGHIVLGELFGRQFAVGSTALRWFCLGQFVFAMTGPSGPTLMMTGHQRAAVSSMLIPLPVLLLAPVAIQQFGFAGIAALVGAYVASNNMLQWYFVRSRLGLKTEPCFDSTFLRRAAIALRASDSPKSAFDLPTSSTL